GCLSLHTSQSLLGKLCGSLHGRGYRWTKQWPLPCLQCVALPPSFSLPRPHRGQQSLRALLVLPLVGQWLGQRHSRLLQRRPRACSVLSLAAAAGFLLLPTASTRSEMLPMAAGLHNLRER